MATVIDALVVTLGLDASGFFQGQKRLDEARGRMRDNADADDKADEQRTQKQLGRFRALATAALEFYATLTIGKDLLKFAGDTITTDAATGRLAHNLGIATDRLGEYQSAVKQVGGAADDANTSLNSLVMTTKAQMAFGDYSNANILQNLGIGPADLNNVDVAVHKLATAFQGKDPGMAQLLGQQLGLSANFVNLLEEGPQALDRRLAAARRAGVATDADAKRAQTLQTAMVLLQQSTRQVGRTILEQLIPVLNKLVSLLTTITNPIPAFIKPTRSNEKTLDYWGDLWYRATHGGHDPPPSAPHPVQTPSVVSPSAARPMTLFSALEKQFGLPAGFLDRDWEAESSRGRHMLSPAGARGHFGFMPDTARQYGVKDPNDLAQAATGAARYFHDLLSRYGGDLAKAAAAYNWGPQRLDLDLLLHGNRWRSYLPKETQGYLAKLGQGVTVGAINIGTINAPGGPAQVRQAARQGVSDALKRYTSVQNVNPAAT